MQVSYLRQGVYTHMRTRTRAPIYMAVIAALMWLLAMAMVAGEEPTLNVDIEYKYNVTAVEFGGVTYYTDDTGLYYKYDEAGNHLETYRRIVVTTTAYTWADGIGDPAAGNPATTATGADAKNTYGIATCWGAIPRGTVLHVPGYGTFPVDDKCGRARKLFREENIILLDLRIREPSPDSTARRTPDEIRQIALNHGIRRDRPVLMRIWPSPEVEEDK